MYGFLEFSGTSNFVSFFLSNKSFNFSITLEGASLILSNTIEYPFSIALYNIPLLNFNSVLYSEDNF